MGSLNITTAENISKIHSEMTTVYSVTSHCLPIEDKIASMLPSIRLIFGIIFGLSIVVEFPVNVLMVYLIHVTKQHKNQSTRLVMYASILDSFGSLSYNSIFIVYMTSYEQLTCTALLIFNTVASFTVIGTAKIAVLIAIDRLIRIKYLNDYNLVFTRKRHYQAVAIMVGLALAQVCSQHIFNFAISKLPQKKH